MTTTATNNNHRTRKQLSDQLDRLDGILDGLADALNESVATAVREATFLAVKKAVQGVLKEVLHNPEIRTHFLPPPPDALPVQPSWRDRINSLKAGMANRWKDLRSGTQQAAQGVGQGVGTCWQGARQAVTKV